MGPERKLWIKLREGMAPYWRVQRIETGTSPGVPDVWYCFPSGDSGWLELKALPAWPKRAATIVRLPHFRPEQRAWMPHIGKYIGNVYLLLQVGSGSKADVLLFSWPQVALLGTLNQEDMIKVCQGRWQGVPIDYQRLVQLLTGTR
jgi:hypothetical protein